MRVAQLQGTLVQNQMQITWDIWNHQKAEYLPEIYKNSVLFLNFEVWYTLLLF